MLAILTFQKTATDSVNHADSGDIKILVQFPGNSILSEIPGIEPRYKLYQTQ